MSYYDELEHWKREAETNLAEIHHLHNRINVLEMNLNAKRREVASERLHVQALKNDMDELKRAYRADVDNLREPCIPSGDEHKGYFCDCGCEVDYPFEQQYCSYCGAQFDWSGHEQNIEEWLHARPSVRPPLDRLHEPLGVIRWPS